jgi:membrane protein
MTKLQRIFITLPPIELLIRASKSIVVPNSGGMSFFDVAKVFFSQMKKIGFNERAAAISFNLLMAIPAGMIFLFTLIPLLPISQQFNKELLRTLKDILLNQKTYDLVQTVVSDVLTTPRKGLLSFSFFLAIFFSSNAMMGIMRTFDRSYYEQRKGKFLVKRWTAIKLTSLLVMLIFTTILLLTTQGPIRKLMLHSLGWNGSLVSDIIKYTRWIIIVMLNFFSISLTYRFAPAVKNRWSIFSPGAIIANALTILITYLFSLWVNNFGRYNQVYGSIGTVIIIMNLVYFNALILLIGFEINVSVMAVKSKIKSQNIEVLKSN